MSEWAQKSISDCAEILDNLRIPVNGETRANNIGSTPYYGANGLQGYIDGHIFDEPLILIAEDGGYFDEYATRSIAYRISGKSWVNNHAHILRPKQELDFDFLFYSLEHKNIIPFIKGGTRAKLNQAELREIKIALPPTKKIQQRIASILINIDTAIKKTESLIAKYQKIKAGLMHDLFTRGVTADGKLRPPREQASELYHETPVGWIPKDWSPISLRNLVGAGNIINGPFGSDLLTSELKAEGVPVFYVQDVKAGFFSRVSTAHVTEQKANELAFCNVRHGDVLVAKVGAPPCDSCVYCLDEKAIVTQDVIRIRPGANVIGEYLSSLLNSPFGRKAVKRISIEGTRERVSLTEFKNLVFPIAGADEQVLISARLEIAQASIAAEIKKSEKLKLQKSGLMHDLLTGKVPVKIDESDQEPA